MVEVLGRLPLQLVHHLLPAPQSGPVRGRAARCGYLLDLLSNVQASPAFSTSSAAAPPHPTRRVPYRVTLTRARLPATWPPPPPQKTSHTRRRCAGPASQRAPRTLRSPSPPARSPICMRPPQPPSRVPCSRHRFAPPLLPPYSCGRHSRTFRRRLCGRTRMIRCSIHGFGRGPGRIRRPGRHRRRRFA